MKTKSARIRSIDIFRGLTIFLMIFVNDLPSVKNISFWLKHMPADQSGMTLPDIVFPAFLFIVGMSIPLALKKRMKIGESSLKIIQHILVRSMALIILGILMVNIGGLNEELTGITKNLWTFLMFISVILVWSDYSGNDKKYKVLFRILKVAGVISLLVLAVIYRSGSVENPEWLKTSWWGILGLIGWAYLFSSLGYYFSKQNLMFMIVLLGTCLALYIGDHEGAFDFLLFNKSFLLIGPHLTGNAAITISGIILTMIFSENGFLSDHRSKIKKAFQFALILAFIGYCLEPLYGISKIYNTPAFSLYSSAICIFVFVLLYWIIDLKGEGDIFNLFNPAGSNPLLAYILPSIVYSLIVILGLSSYFDFWREGILGILRSVIFSFIILWFTNLMTKARIQLKL